MEAKLGARCPGYSPAAAAQRPAPLRLTALAQRRQCTRAALPSTTPPLERGGGATGGAWAVCPPAAALVQQLLQPGAPAVDPLPDEVPDLEVDVVGAAWHLGVDMEWRLSFSTDGSFREELISPQTSYSSGYDAAAAPGSCTPCSSSASSSSSNGNGSGEPSSSCGGGGGGGTGPSASSYCCAPGVCWGSDDAGCPRRLQLDDEESLLLSTWIRAGMWVVPSVAALLSIREVPPPASSSSSSGSSGGGSSSSSSGSRVVRDGEEEGQQREAVAAGGTVWLELRLKQGGRVAALLELCSASWRPLSAQLHLAGERELWRFSDWRQCPGLPGLWLAASAVQSSSGEGSPRNEYRLRLLESRPAARAAGAAAAPAGRGGTGGRFAPPPTPLLPADSSFLPGQAEGVPAWHTVSGHSLVKPRLNGKEVGYFIFDTGASGFVLDPQAADALGLEAFGELQVISMVGRIGSRFRRAESFQLGPLVMERPLFMELPCSGIVSGVPDGGRVVGIVGYDVLRRAVVHMPPHPYRPTLPPSAVASVDSPAAAVAAAASASKLRMGALPFMVRLQHPAALEPDASSDSSTLGGSPGSSSNGGGSGSSSSSMTGPALPPSSSSSSAAAAAAAAPAAESSSAPAPAPPSVVPSSSSSSTRFGSQRIESSSGGGSLGRPGSRRAGLQVQDLRRHERHLSPPEPPQWLPLVMVSSLPHIELELLTMDGQRHKGLFMMDSGAGGFDIILGARAARSMQLGAAPPPAGATSTTQIKGVGGGTQDRITAHNCQLAEVRLGLYRFHSVQALYHSTPPGGTAGGGAGLELSQHTSGIVCAGLLGRCGLVFDYARMRVAVAGPGSVQSV
ncbi:hypothetical protein ABPG75_011238 [Micractinium tetrahymenae]